MKLKPIRIPQAQLPTWMWYALLGIALSIHLLTLPVTIMGPDGARYASIAKTMVENGNYFELYLNGEEWLDKPHFQFWVTALSYELFGINTFAYKFPAILFIFLGAFYTYRLAERLYNQEVARWSALIFLTAEHLIISNVDVRAESYLTGLIIAAVYHFYRSHQGEGNWGGKHLLVGALFSAMAVMTKGVYVLVPIGFSVIGQIVMQRQWRQLFQPKWFLAILLTAIFLTPELYALYYQFDAHPEKVVFGQTGVSGIRFFLWDSQWGRFSNTGPIKGRGDFFLFFHTVLWAFLPWGILLYAAVIRKFRRNIPKVKNGEEFYTLSAALVTFLLFSLSGFQLPYYLNILFPFFAILTSAYIYRLTAKGGVRFYTVVQYITIGLLFLAGVSLHFFFRPEPSPVWLWIGLSVLGGLFFLVRAKDQGLKPVVFWRSCIAAFMVNLYLMLAFYPKLLSYQAGSEAAWYINEHFPEEEEVTIFGWTNSAFTFYLDQPLHWYDLETIRRKAKAEDLLVLATPEGYEELMEAGMETEVIRTFDYWRLTLLTGPFLHYKTRDEVLEKRFLLRVGQGDKETGG